MGIQKEGSVTGRGNSKNGKPFIKIDGQTYYAGKTDLAGLVVGDRIQFTATSFGERGDLWGIDNGWKLLEGAQKYPGASQPSNGIAAPAPSSAPQKAILAGSPVQDVERPAISNWVAAAIQAGALTDPQKIHDWVRCAKQALREDGSIGEDKDIPY